MKKLKIAIVDVIGLPYDGTTLTKKGIGGSESSIISIARELVKIGFDVTVFGDNNKEGASEGIYDGVEYCLISRLLEKDYNFDIAISQRTVVPFTPPHLYDQVKQPPPRDHDVHTFAQIQKPHVLKILWLQDSFCWGDHILEQLVVEKYIDELFVLSDWHLSYTLNSSHGPRRNFEVLKNKTFLTRNAINRWIDWVDVKEKDPNLFVYNASVTKGMVPLLERIWPRIKQELPQARLKIIGGYYQFPNEPINEQGKTLLRFQEQYKDDPSVEFTGIIPQPQIAEILAKANFTIYPGAFPETSGISTLESINYNTPVIGTRFGAMEETATEMASYMIDYAVEPNTLFNKIDTIKQCKIFTNKVLEVYHNPYLHQQKKYACNAAKDVSTWDTVALQWKQHFYFKLGHQLTENELAKVSWINYRVHKVFGRRTINPDEIIVHNITTKPSLSNFNLHIAFIDIQGMAYDGDTLNHRGLGGSESAIILVAKELVKIGFKVTVFNACNEDDARPGVYDGVSYRPIAELSQDDYQVDVMIGSRTIMPFITEKDYNIAMSTVRDFNYKTFKRIRDQAKLKVFWMHDTFSWGDEHLEHLVVNGSIHEIWCLSDFHTQYVMNCDHGNLRNYEVLRPHMWITRNGITKYFDKVDLDKKNPHQFVFNANMSKGLEPLLHHVWPRVKARLPEAKLKVIGGFYKLGSAFGEVHDQEGRFNAIVGTSRDDPSIEFLGVITQKAVADVCAESSFFIYPAQMPETYGISTLESLYANTPLITCRFGALEETATDQSWMIDYAISPNYLFPNINFEQQINKFVDLVIEAASNPKELRRRQDALEHIKHLAGWDVTALQWKHRIYHNLGIHLTRYEYQLNSYFTSIYNKIFDRRTQGLELTRAPRISDESKFVIISPFWNCKDYIGRCIASVAAQDYDNYQHYLIDDASDDGSYDAAKNYIDQLPEDIKSKFHLIKNTTRNGSAVANQITTIKSLNLEDNDIVVLLDGDDCLMAQYDIFTYYNELHKHSDFIYGSCWSEVDNIPLISQPYPPDVKNSKSYRQYMFNWRMPYTHLRTMKAKLIKDIPESKFKDNAGNWFKAGGDNSTFYLPLENCDPSRVTVNSDLTCSYNDRNPLNDYKVNGVEQNITADQILNQTQDNLVHIPKKAEVKMTEIVQVQKNKKRILIAIPNRVGIEVETFKAIYDLVIPDGYETTFQYFYGYQVEQVRNLIGHWVVSGGWDYLFSVDSDIAFPSDTLQRLLAHDKDMVSALYIQRIPGTHTVEVMRKNQYGGVFHVPYEDLKGRGLVEVDTCGFGCVLIKREVFTSTQYPWFEYKSSLDHGSTVSEDTWFCQEAQKRGHRIWADTSILCDHIGSYTYRVEDQHFEKKPPETELKKHIRDRYEKDGLSGEYNSYLLDFKKNDNINPKVIYDIGAGNLHWTKILRSIWPDSKIIAFDASQEHDFLYQEQNIDYHIDVLSDSQKTVKFYKNGFASSGNSYYRENPAINPNAEFLFSEDHARNMETTTLKEVVDRRSFPRPDMIVMDVQGSEIDILEGAKDVLENCRDVFLSIQFKEYNIGAPLSSDVFAFMDSIGFSVVSSVLPRINNLIDADFHFTRKS